MSRTRPTQRITVARVRNLAVEIARRKAAIARERDALRALIEDANDIADNADEANAELDSAVLSMERAADALSQYL